MIEGELRKAVALAMVLAALVAPGATAAPAPLPHLEDSSPPGADLYVSPSGNDSNLCTQFSPCREIRRALALVSAGDTILVADGQYKGFDVDSKSGATGQPITIKANGTGAVVVNTTDRPDNRDTIFITGSNWIVVDGLRSFDASRAAVRVDASNNVTIRNGVFGNNTRWGIFTDFSNDLVIEGNEAYGSRIEHGIYVSNSPDRPIVRGNRVHDNNANGLHFNGDISQGGDGLVQGALVENNVIWGNGNAGGAGINMDGPQDSVIRNNLLYDNHAGGVTQYRIDAAAGPKNNLIAHNTIDMASDGRWALLVTGSEGPVKVRNNIFHNRNAARGGISYGAASDVTNTDSDFNIMDRVTPDDGSTVLTLAQWQAQGHEKNSSSATPAQMWVSPGSDYHLTGSSAALDKGQTLAAVPVDIEGNARPQGNASDVGAYERAGGSPVFQVSATANPRLGVAPLDVAFTADATGAKPPYTWLWAFGDGNASTAQNPMHTYESPGNYTAKVTGFAQLPSRNASATLKITVTKPSGGTPALTSVKLTPGTADLAAGGQAKFTAEAFDQNSKSILFGVAWAWERSPASLGTIAPANGSSTATLTAGNATVKGLVTVHASHLGKTVTVSAPVSVKAAAGGAPPWIKIVKPSHGEAVRGIVKITVNVTKPVVKVDFIVDGSFRSSSSKAPFDGQWDASAAAPGNHVIRAQAYNASDGSAIDEVTVLVESTGGGGGSELAMPPWFWVVMVVFVFGILMAVGVTVYGRRRRRRRREEWHRQKRVADEFRR